jgi:hypothetical protein
MIECDIYDIWYTQIPFEGEQDGKDRPVLIVNMPDEEQVMVLMITSSNPRDEYDMVIEQWADAGLENKSVIRTRRRFRVESGKLRRKAGTLQGTDRLRLLLKLSE